MPGLKWHTQAQIYNFIIYNSWSTLGYLGGKLSWMLLPRAPTWLDVLPQHADVIVPVGATLFVVEAEGVEELVLDGAVVQAALTVQGQTLGVTLATHVGVAAAHRQRLECVIKMKKKKKNVVILMIFALIFGHFALI